MARNNDKAAQLEMIADNPDIVSINNRKRLNEIQTEYPNREIIIGARSEDDKPVSLDLAEMEHSKNEIVDAATNTVLGMRNNRLEKPTRFPLPLVTGIVGFLLGVAATFYVYTM